MHTFLVQSSQLDGLFLSYGYHQWYSFLWYFSSCTSGTHKTPVCDILPVAQPFSELSPGTSTVITPEPSPWDSTFYLQLALQLYCHNQLGAVSHPLILFQLTQFSSESYIVGWEIFVVKGFADAPCVSETLFADAGHIQRFKGLLRRQH